MKGDIVIFGAGGHGRVCADVATAAGFSVVGFCDNDKNRGDVINGIKVQATSLNELAEISPADETQLFIAVGDNETRKTLYEEAQERGFSLPNLIHPASVISPFSSIGSGTVVMPAAVVNTNAEIGHYCIVNTSCSIDHDSVLEDGVQLSPGVRSAGTVHFGAMAFVGTGATIIPGVKIGKSAAVAAGAVVVRDVADGVRVAGVPAKEMSP